MKKTVQFEIGGISFSIEETAFAKLSEYIDSLKSYFKGFEENSEIISDIEARIAEKLYKNTQNTRAINDQDVTEIMASMGNVSDFDNEYEDPKEEYKITENVSQHANYQSFYKDSKHKAIGGVFAGLADKYSVDVVWLRILFVVLGVAFIDDGLSFAFVILYLVCWLILPTRNDIEEKTNIKKFFRLPENKVLGGVATGLSSYLKIDLAIVRLIFVVLGITGVGILIYVLFWIIAPNAITITQKMELHGQSLTIKNIETSLKENTGNLAYNQESTLSKLLLFPFRIIGLIFKGLGKISMPILKFLKIILGLFLILMGGVFMFAALVITGAFYGLFDYIKLSPEFLRMIALELPSLGGIFVFFVSFIPAFAITVAGFSLVSRNRYGNQSFWGTLAALWIGGLIGFGMFGAKFATNFSHTKSAQEEIKFALPAKNLILSVNEQSEDNNFFNENENEVILKTADNEVLNAKIEYFAKGKTNEVAMQNAKNILYPIVQNDTNLVFEKNITVKGEKNFRNQRVNVDLYIPKGKLFKMSQRFFDKVLRKNHILKETIGYENAENIEKYTFKMDADNAIVCVDCPIIKHSSANAENAAISENVDYGNLPKFNKIEISSAFKVELKQGATQKVSVFGNDELKVDVRVENGTLQIDLKNNIQSDDNISIEITVPEIEEILLSGAVELNSSNFNNFKQLKLDISGASKVDFEGSVKKLDIIQSGASNLTLKGKVDFADIEITGASILNAKDCIILNADVEASGASHADFNKIPKLNSQTSGASEISND